MNLLSLEKGCGENTRYIVHNNEDPTRICSGITMARELEAKGEGLPKLTQARKSSRSSVRIERRRERAVGCEPTLQRKEIELHDTRFPARHASSRASSSPIAAPVAHGKRTYHSSAVEPDPQPLLSSPTLLQSYTPPRAANAA